LLAINLLKQLKTAAVTADAVVVPLQIKVIANKCFKKKRDGFLYPSLFLS
jgi:hypothetical protein